MSYRPMFKFHLQNDVGNAQRFATREEAEKSAAARFAVWTAPIGYRIEESDDPVNYQWVDGANKMI